MRAEQQAPVNSRATAPMRSPRIAVVGGGKMGEAILSGWITAADGPAAGISASDIVVVEPGEDRRRYLSETHGIACVPDASLISVDEAPDVVVLSVKPQVMMGVLESLGKLEAFAVRQGGRTGEAVDAPAADVPAADVPTADGEAPGVPASAADEGTHVFPLFISIAAGLTTDKIAGGLPEGAPLVRVMPNMPLMVGQGASGVCASTTSTARQVAYVADLFGCLGRAVIVDEGDMDAVCALSGSGPAYVAAMVEAMRDAAVARGLDAQLAETLALQTVLGTAQLISETGVSPQAAREAVCSPGGTTLAALDAMNAAGFAHVFDAGIEAAIVRSKELAQCSS